jgi:hypothetical protein
MDPHLPHGVSGGGRTGPPRGAMRLSIRQGASGAQGAWNGERDRGGIVGQVEKGIEGNNSPRGEKSKRGPGR